MNTENRMLSVFLYFITRSFKISTVISICLGMLHKLKRSCFAQQNKLNEWSLEEQIKLHKNNSHYEFVLGTQIH